MKTLEVELASLSSGSSRHRFKRGSRSLRRSSLFSLYAKIFRVLLTKWDRASLGETSEEDEYSRELDTLVLPSNEDWRLRVYYRLVELQRERDHLQHEADTVPEELP